VLSDSIDHDSLSSDPQAAELTKGVRREYGLRASHNSI
jgi:hypothetical protein